MERAIVHLDIPDYFAAIEERRGRRGYPLAFAVPGAVIQAVNSHARDEGIREGMPLYQAQRLCRRLRIIPPDLAAYRKHHEALLKRFLHYTPLVEGTALGHFFLDLSGTGRLWGPAADVAFSMEKALFAEEGLRVRAGLAANKLVSQVAAHVGSPGDLRYIFPGLEASFLHPLPVEALPGVGEKTTQSLLDLNIERVGELSGLKPEEVCAVLGRGGRRLLRIARGIDPTPVLPQRLSQRLSIVQELAAIDRVEALLLEMSEEAGWQLRSLNRSPGGFSLEVRYADGKTARAQTSLPASFSRLDREIFSVARATLTRLPFRRVAIRRLCLEFSPLQMALRQLPLFSQDASRLQETLDSIRGRFGRLAIRWGSP